MTGNLLTREVLPWTQRVTSMLQTMEMRQRAVVDVLNILWVVAVLVQGFVPAAQAGDFWMYERGAPEVGTAQSGLMDIPAAATSKLPTIAQSKIPILADAQRTALAQARAQASDQKKSTDCTALEQDLFI